MLRWPESGDSYSRYPAAAWKVLFFTLETFGAWRWWEATVKTKINVHNTAGLVNTMCHQLRLGDEGFIIEELRLERNVSLST